MTVQFNDMIATIKRNENWFVIILGFKTADCNNKITENNIKYYNTVTFIDVIHVVPLLTLINHASVLPDTLSRPNRECTQKRIQLLIPEQKCDIAARHFCVANVVYCQRFADVVKLLLKCRVLLGELAL